MSALPPHAALVGHLRASLGKRRRRPLRIEDFRPAAVALLLRGAGGQTVTPLTRRAASLRQHSGQISLPGGVRDLTDDSLVTTARRETFEELGIAPERIDVLGLLDDVPTPTGFVITPVVAELRGAAPYRLNPREVAEVFEVPLAKLAEPSAKRDLGPRQIDGRSYRVIAYRAGDHEIWGATARILEMLIEELIALT